MNRVAGFSALLLTGVLPGCASTLSGVGGSDGYACRAPAGATCTAISGVYAQASRTPPPGRVAAAEPPAPAAGAALRTPARVLRLWIAPWEDSDGDLNDAALVHVVVDHGRWRIEHLRPPPRIGSSGVRPPEPAPMARTAPPAAPSLPALPPERPADAEATLAEP